MATSKTPRKTSRKPVRRGRAAAKPVVSPTTIALSVGAVALAAGAAVFAFLSRGRIAEALAPDTAEHVPTDLLGSERPKPDDRAPVEFRPDMAAPMSAAEREALRPATGPAPSLIADRGTMNAQTGSAN